LEYSRRIDVCFLLFTSLLVISLDFSSGKLTLAVFASMKRALRAPSSLDEGYCRLQCLAKVPVSGLKGQFSFTFDK